MNSSFTILTFWKMIRKNIILFLSIFLLVTVSGVVAGSILYTNSYTVTITCSLTITENNNIGNTGLDYTSQYYDNASSFIKDASLLEKTAEVYNLKLKDLKNDISYSRSYGIISITYTTETTNTNGSEILLSVFAHWSGFINNKSLSAVSGRAEVILGPINQTDLTSTLLLFVLAFLIVGLVLGICAATVKSFYSKTIIDPVFISSVINIPLLCKIKVKKINDDIPYKKILLEAARIDAKVLCFTTINGPSKDSVVASFTDTLKNNDYKVGLIDFSQSINSESKDLIGSIYNFKDDSPFKERIEALKNDNDFVIINSLDTLDDIKFALNKYSDLTIMNIQINSTPRKELKSDLSIMEKDNKNIIGVIVE